jgi:DNA polymerase III epsilon subunit-like protein
MKYKLLFIDTETTGNEEKDYLCQVAYSDGIIQVNELFNPPIPIPPEASAVHHITNKMVENKPVFKFSKEYNELHEMAHDEKTVFVAHNAPFDLAMLKKEGIIPDMWICTLRLARHLDPDEKISSYRLQYLRYLLGIEIEATAHDAMGDVLVLEQLFDRLKKKMEIEVGDDTEKIIEKMMEISSHPSLLKTFNFGKYKDKKIADVVNTDKGYLEWLLAQKLQNETGDEDWIYTLKHYLGK